MSKKTIVFSLLLGLNAFNLFANTNGKLNLSFDYITHLANKYNIRIDQSIPSLLDQPTITTYNNYKNFNQNFFGGGLSMGFKFNNMFMIGAHTGFYSKEIPKNDSLISQISRSSVAGTNYCTGELDLKGVCTNVYTYQSSGFDLNTYLIELSLFLGNNNIIQPFVKFGAGDIHIKHYYYESSLSQDHTPNEDLVSKKISADTLGLELGTGIMIRINNYTNFAISYNYLWTANGVSASEPIDNKCVVHDKRMAPYGESTNCNPSDFSSLRFNQIGLHALKLSFIIEFEGYDKRDNYTNEKPCTKKKIGIIIKESDENNNINLI